MVLAPSIFAQNYVVERHLSTKTPYEQRQSLSRGNSPAYSPKHGSSQPLFTYWLARHGTRWPTQKRMQQIQELQNVFKLAGQEAEQAHPWVNKWTNPFKDSIHLAGHLHPKGVKEMQHMGQDFKKYLLAVKDQELLVSVEVHATAKARTQDSAKAFMQGLYGGTHTYTDCQAYDEYVAQTDADFLDAWKQQEWCAHIPRLAEGLGLDPGMLTGRHVDALWHLCQQEAGLWNITHQACSLFPSQEAQHMEWVDDVQLFMRKGAASPVAYNMAAPLLADIATSLQEAAAGTGRSGLHAKLSIYINAKRHRHLQQRNKVEVIALRCCTMESGWSCLVVITPRACAAWSRSWKPRRVREAQQPLITLVAYEQRAKRGRA
ncbi:hypothetical protein WJX82_000945 [Trebouxia sp. C0006]